MNMRCNRAKRWTFEDGYDGQRMWSNLYNVVLPDFVTIGVLLVVATVITVTLLRVWQLVGNQQDC